MPTATTGELRNVELASAIAAYSVAKERQARLHKGSSPASGERGAAGAGLLLSCRMLAMI